MQKELSQGNIEIKPKIRLTQGNIAKHYTPGVAELCKKIQKDPRKVNELTWKKRTVAVVSDGTAILGLGNIGPLAGYPVMEAKALIFKQQADLNAVPILLNTQDPGEIVETVKRIAPSFGGINIEDIAAPSCFIVKERLKKELDIPVFHDDQYGTAIVVLAGLINAAKVVGKDLKKAKIIVLGAGAAGVATAKLLDKCGCGDIIIFDSKGPLHKGRVGEMNFAKTRMASKTNKEDFKGTVQEALEGADVFIGLSKGNILKQGDVAKMSKDAIVFALANPTPEIHPDKAKRAGAKVVATGRGDFPNQINNALVFPGIFKGAIESDTRLITKEIMTKAAKSLAEVVKKPTTSNIIPRALNKEAVEAISGAFY
jgi:malate dehydrogenase (oxaloacetate-decarboxylating)